MNCQHVIDFLNDYREGRLPWWQMLIFRVHLLACSECRRYLASYEQTIQMTRQLAVEPNLPQVPESLVQAILAIRESQFGS
jgi:predicted anti-sigma-YlaC factor YlaD